MLGFDSWLFYSWFLLGFNNIIIHFPRRIINFKVNFYDDIKICCYGWNDPLYIGKNDPSFVCKILLDKMIPHQLTDLQCVDLNNLPKIFVFMLIVDTMWKNSYILCEMLGKKCHEIIFSQFHVIIVAFESRTQKHFDVVPMSNSLAINFSFQRGINIDYLPLQCYNKVFTT